MVTLYRRDGEIIGTGASVRAICEAKKHNLRGANLRGADLKWANLVDANLRAANLRGADLKWANLVDANLRAANLRGASLWGTTLWGADLRGADLWGADLWCAMGIVSFGPCPPSGRIGYIVAHDPEPMVQLGCWWEPLSKTLDELRAKRSPAYVAIVEAAAMVLAEQQESAK